MKILLAEDDGQLARSIAKRIGAAGYALDTVATGEQAVEALSGIAYALLILDRRLPDGDGVKRIATSFFWTMETPPLKGGRCSARYRAGSSA